MGYAPQAGGGDGRGARAACLERRDIGAQQDELRAVQGAAAAQRCAALQRCGHVWQPAGPVSSNNACSHRVVIDLFMQVVLFWLLLGLTKLASRSHSRQASRVLCSAASAPAALPSAVDAPPWLLTAQ